MADPSHVLSPTEFEVREELSYSEEPVMFLDRKGASVALQDDPSCENPLATSWRG